MSAPDPSMPRSRPSAVGRRIAGFFLSFLVAGGGHVLLGRWRRGLVLVAGVVVLLLSVPWTRSVGSFGFVILYLAIPFDVLFIRPGPRPAWGRLVAAWVAIFALLLFLRSSIRNFYLEAFTIPAAAMAPTLVPGDHIFVEKFRRNADRGDVIVFRSPKEPDTDYVMRVVGVGGDQVEVRAGTLRVNGEPIEETEAAPCEYMDHDSLGGQWVERTARCSEVTLGTGARYVVAHTPDAPSRDFPEDSAEPFVVPKDSLFVMGDNREDSFDSRFWGPVPIDHVKGTALFIWWSSGGDGVRWNRVGQAIY